MGYGAVGRVSVAALALSLAAGPLPAQDASADRGEEPPAASALPGPRVSAPLLQPGIPAPVLEPERAEAALSAADAAPPSAEDFAYQVLMIVITAVVTALVWKALD
jgi:hypothetical protein